jgi:hypothetical protein
MVGTPTGAHSRGPLALRLTLHGVVFDIFVSALPGTAEATLCQVRDTGLPGLRRGAGQR